MKNKKEKQEYPLIPLRKIVLFPHNIIPIFLDNKSHIKAIDLAMKEDRIIFVATKKQLTNVDFAKKKNQIEENLHPIGTIARILQVMKMPDGSLRVLIQGQQRATIEKIIEKEKHDMIQILPLENNLEINDEMVPLMKLLQESFQSYLKVAKEIPTEVKNMIFKAEFPDKLVDLICGTTQMNLEHKLEIIHTTDTKERLEKTAQLLETEIAFSNLQMKIKQNVKEKMDEKQKEYFLNEQIREINKELGRIPDEIDDIAELHKKIDLKNLPKEIHEKAKKELNRLSSLQPVNPEYGSLRFYIDWIIDLPWNEKSKDNRDIILAKKILNEDHFDLEKPKERILDFIAVTQLNESIRGPILCFIGPPGTGKTSLGKSVARALNREFVRISLGGVRDEAEIRGHRKTYIGALPGKIIQSMKKAKTTNPVFLLDEIDKINSDFRGDPAAALLEVLDPEQNATFTDHYLGVPYNLSKVMFIATANSLHKIPAALRDRLEIIEIPGYTDLEKIQIAKRFIIPKQIKENGLDWADIQITKKALEKIIDKYTMESGVRNLERTIAKIIRKIAREAIEKGYGEKKATERSESLFKVKITEKKISNLLGKKRYNKDLLFNNMHAGNINGLAWTESGGTLLPVEAITYEGEGKLILTGNLGDVMKESAHTALSYVKANRNLLNLEKNFSEKKDIHLHVPEGAIPKDGPSAGITMMAALFSTFSKLPPKKNFAMTGELTLTGKVLPIGGLKEKVLAAYRNNIVNIILPMANKIDMIDIPNEVQNKIKFYFIDRAEEIIPILFIKEEKNTKEK